MLGVRCTRVRGLHHGVVCVLCVPLSIGGSDQLVVYVDVQTIRLGVEDGHQDALEREGEAAHHQWQAERDKTFSWVSPDPTIKTQFKIKSNKLVTTYPSR